MYVCILDVTMVTEMSTGDTFYELIQTQHLINPHSVVICDNCSIHHCGEVITNLNLTMKSELKSMETFDTETALLA